MHLSKDFTQTAVSILCSLDGRMVRHSSRICCGTLLMKSNSWHGANCGSGLASATNRACCRHSKIVRLHNHVSTVFRLCHSAPMQIKCKNRVKPISDEP